MRRREFLNFVGGAAAEISVSWPLAVHAQSSMPVIGFLGLTSPQEFAALTAAFKQGLNETGFVEGQNVAVEYRWAHGQFEQLPALASDLVQQRVNVIAALGTPASAMAARQATTTIPIVFVSGGDPVAIGLVDSLNRPAGNATGIYMLTVALEPKRLELMHDVMPNVTVIGVIVDPKSPDTVEQLKELTKAATALDREIQVINVSTENEIDAAFAAMAERRIGAAIVTSSPSYLPLRQRFIALAARYAIPTAYYVRGFADAGGLMSYGTSLPDAYRQAGVYTGRILKGDKPAGLPIQQSVKVELVINMKTAKTLGLSIPLSLLGRADEVIE
ncbi:MAG TPA: ABC transporter substrate-binding protein [Xanthobacteraceae bacterium]|jgi:putative ABC transport system substrate-binding protein|nr:ABC transporter substrate-binding protein [Xanthobacteraceae bacterium]